MKTNSKTGLDFEIDKLTNSIENVVTGDSFQTDITLVSKTDLKTASKKNGWVFDWVYEFKQPERDVYKLTIVNNQSVIQGLIRAPPLIRVDQKFIQVFQVTWLHLHVSFPFSGGMTAMFHSYRNHSLFNIILTL